MFFYYFCIIYNLITKLKLATDLGHCRIVFRGRFEVHDAKWGPLAPCFWKINCPMLIIIFFECNLKFEWILVQYLEIWVKVMSQEL